MDNHPKKLRPKTISVYLLRITLLDLEPPVWRHVLVPGDLTLSKLHEILQVVMGWEGSHLWEFQVKDERLGPPDAEMPEVRDARKARLDGFKLTKGSSFGYTYDFGDNWEHEIVVETVEKPQPDARYPVCVGGRRACPPEDCGGTGGYEDLLEAISDPGHEGHEDAIEWLGANFDPEHFSAEEVNAGLEDFGLRKRSGKAKNHVNIPPTAQPDDPVMRALAEKLRDPTAILDDAQVKIATVLAVESMPKDFLEMASRFNFRLEDVIRLGPLHAKFKREREARGLSIAEVSRLLKVPQYRLKAIEGQSTSSIAPPFVRTYAQFLELEKWLSEWAAANRNLAERIVENELKAEKPRKRPRS